MKIAYNDNEGLKILTPAIDIDIRIIADKDVPAGLYYKLISPSDLPPRETSRSFKSLDEAYLKKNFQNKNIINCIAFRQ